MANAALSGRSPHVRVQVSTLTPLLPRSIAKLAAACLPAACLLAAAAAACAAAAAAAAAAACWLLLLPAAAWLVLLLLTCGYMVSLTSLAHIFGIHYFIFLFLCHRPLELRLDTCWLLAACMLACSCLQISCNAMLFCPSVVLGWWLLGYCNVAGMRLQAAEPGSSCRCTAARSLLPYCCHAARSGKSGCRSFELFYR